MEPQHNKAFAGSEYDEILQTNEDHLRCVVCLSRRKMPYVQWCEECEEIVMKDRWDPNE